MLMNRLKYKFLKLLCYTLSFVMAICLVLAVVFSVSVVTFNNKDFKTSYFKSDKVINQLSLELENNLENLCNEYDVPSDVFMSAVDKTFISNQQDTVVNGFYGSEKIDFDATSELSKKYKTAVSNYCTDNSIKKSDAEIEKITNKAVDIFNTTCSVENNSELCTCAVKIGSISIPEIILLAAAFSVCNFFEYILNGKRRKFYNYTAMSCTVSGCVMSVISAMALIMNSRSALCLTNIAAYNSAINNIVNTVLLIYVLLGVVLIIIGAAIFINVFRHYKDRLIIKDTDQEINDNLL